MGYGEVGEMIGMRVVQLALLLGGFHLGKKIFKKKEVTKNGRSIITR